VEDPISVSEKKRRRTTRMAVAGPGALASVVLIGAVAFGASSLRGPSADAVDTDPGTRAAEPKPSLTITAQRTHGPDHDAWAAVGDQGAVSTTVEGIASETRWYVRVQAIRATALGKMVVGQGTVLTWTAP
jgi:hypothetical protein